MSTNRWILAALLSGTLALAVSAQESEEEAPPAADEAPPAEPAPPPRAEEGRTLEEIFIPSEEIAADEEVTFPINI
ncbi:MAG: hypothetical protein GWN29_03905 [Gammaproteobacteria bacterium]|nr:hypothetical protein [Gammaproteobacteria bacterium]